MSGEHAHRERQLAESVRALLAQRREQNAKPPAAVAGFDGFIDEIQHAVDKRESADAFERVPTIEALAERIRNAAGRSANIELVTQRVKPGGNGPILAGALGALGAAVTYIGAVGYPGLHSVFQPLERFGRVFSLAEPAHTDALEFRDGKILLGKMESLRKVTWDRLVSVVGLDNFTALLEACDVLAPMNWTMIPDMTDIMERIAEEVCPRLTTDRARYAFFDLADPEKRTTADIRRMLGALPRFQGPFRVALGLNEREARAVCGALGLPQSALNAKFVNELCRYIAAELDIWGVVVHPVEYSVATVGGADYYQDGPTTANPAITTGGGDHLNAGFCMGLALGADPAACLLMGVCCSGFYVINGRSPDMDELLAVMTGWRESQAERTATD